MENRKKTVHYIELFIAVALTVVVYSVLRGFSLQELLPIDEGKAIDDFIANMIDTNAELNQNFFAYCTYNVQNMVMFLLCKLFGNIAVGINIYYIATFWGIAFSAYWLFQKVGISHAISLFGALLLTILPFHTDRAEAQIITASFYMVPIIIAMFYDTFFVESMKIKDFHTRDPLATPAGRRIREKMAELDKKYLFFMILLPWIDLNLSIMTMLLMIVLCLQRFEKDRFYQMLVYGVPALIETAVIYVLANRNRSNDVIETIEKARQEGLRILDFVMPVRRHIYDRFFNLRYEYDTAFSANGESGLNTLGALLAFCFVAGMVGLFIRKKENKLVKWLSWIDIIVILFANISGLGLLLEYIGIHIIYWNRMGIFVIVNSAVVMGIYADALRSWWKEKHYQVVCDIAYVVIAVIAVLDVLLRHAVV